MRNLSLFGLGLSLALLTLSACKDQSSNNEAGESSAIVKDTLLQSKPAGNGKAYQMKILSTPDIIQSGKQVVFSFTPQIVGKETEPVPLETDRGYEMHLIMVSSDLSWFDHRHPGLSDLGTYQQAYTFSKGGVYDLFAEFKPMGSTDTVQMKSFPVNGNSDRPVTYSESKLTSTAGPFEVTLAPVEGIKFESGKMQSISAAITKAGVPVDAKTLGDYLGGKGHMVIIGVKDKDFLHVHPSVENGNLVFHTSFSNPGIYRVWLQIQTENIIHTSDFVMRVDEGSETSMGKDEDDMHTDQH
ncbi:MAG TPA: hypothetical protein VFG10_05620 [Saprospiraceae bacterium]|nr:hypothetical protein [Saprospiraceae bacterium]